MPAILHVLRNDHIIQDGPDPVVNYDRHWFNTTSMAMIALAGTLLIHISNAVTSVRLNFKHRIPSLFLVAMIQSLVAVGCHFCRSSDFFFVTDCQFKPYLNNFCYALSTGLIIAGFSWQLAKATPYFWSFMFFGLLCQGAKHIPAIIYTVHMTVGTGYFQECHYATPPFDAFLFLISEIMVYATMILAWAVIIPIRVYRHNQPWKSAIYYYGAIYTVVCCILGMAILCMIITGHTFDLHLEVFFQSKWAIESMALTAQLKRLHQELREFRRSQGDQPISGFVNFNLKHVRTPGKPSPGGSNTSTLANTIRYMRDRVRSTTSSLATGSGGTYKAPSEIESATTSRS
ncbi:hypothetical protein H4R33_000979 [Dimargaris cristalligena]|uniref:Uncharacterized protein n=1 Tax=Dimargaris cristalligena TaxID=215637 RepID=A0A4Q0A1Q4_9FUNG|nr:hypothetical protein H4R33_000979 [Dimargaris cristalligena]RKP39977.1 hypothetical protein BJ085DRAFT_33699 [Dimargaris cristalligena]|eukprot:RKP39977.1 hypothetical protein BJ085DRAFT_33699 [Dimargaris cristalligena]